MLRSLRLSAVLLAALAFPALAQTPSTTAPGRAVTTPGYTRPSAPSTAGMATTPPLATRPAASATTSNKIDINGATAQQLASLPGIGPALSQHIIDGRPWDDLTDLVKKKAIPQGVFDRNKDRFALANINTSSAAEMAKTLPGIGDVRSRAIVSGRPYASPEDLVGKKVLTQNLFNKIKDLIAF